MENFDDIPALFMWKTLRNTIPVILNLDSTDPHFKTFKNLLESPEFIEMFIYPPDYMMSYEQYNSMWKKYKAFTIWLLGQFFYLLGQEKLTGIHSLLIDAQRKILHAIQTNQSSVYHELTTEYTTALEKLNLISIKADIKNVELNCFIPETPSDLKKLLNLDPLGLLISSKNNCIHMQKITLKFIEEFLVDKMETKFVTSDVYKIFDSLLFILNNSCVELICIVLRIFVAVLKVNENYSNDINVYLKKMFAIFEQLCHHRYLENMQIDSNDFDDITENILKNIQFQKIYPRNLCEFLLKQKDCNRDIIGICNRILYEPENIFKQFLSDVDVSATKITTEIIEHHRNHRTGTKLQVNEKVSKLWAKEYQEIIQFLSQTECSNDHNKLIKFLELSAVIKLKCNFEVNLFEAVIFFQCIQEHMMLHVNSGDFDYASFVNVLTMFVYGCNNAEEDILNASFHLIAQPFCSKIYKNTPVKFNFKKVDKHIENYSKSIYFYADKNNGEKSSMSEVCYFVNLLYLNGNIEKAPMVEGFFIKLCQYWIENEIYEMQIKFIKYLPSMLSHSPKFSEIIDTLFLPSLKSSKINILREVSIYLQDIIKVLCWNYSEAITWKYVDDRLTIESAVVDSANELSDNVVVKDYKNRIESLTTSSKLLDIIKGLFYLINQDDPMIKKNAIKTLPVLAKRVRLFHQVQVPKWMCLLEDPDESVRIEFSNNLHLIVHYIKQDEKLSDVAKNKITDMVFKILKTTMKKSLQSNFGLQNTILISLENLASIKEDYFAVNIIKLLLYYIMMPTSKELHFAKSVLLKMARGSSLSLLKLYSKYRRDICVVIAELCAINQFLAGHNLSTSLEQVALVFGFSGPKYFVAEESRYLLPRFISLLIQMPKVQELIKEIAIFNETDLSELFTLKYGYIFLHIFLSDEDNKKCLEFVEKTARLDRATLIKKNFMIILNELLLNFHDKQDRVMTALRHLAKEDSDSGKQSIQDFLQPRFLGVLHYFDLKLMIPHFDKRKVLLSLAELFKFMGSKHITPLRFKIIAMLRTALTLNTGVYPELNCEVWDAFIRSCDFEALGPHLATILVSILPLREKNYQKIYDILQYICSKEALKDHMPDLFFIVDDPTISEEEKRHFTSRYVPISQNHNDISLEEYLKYFLKYVKHETVDIRIHALKRVKKLLEIRRLELDQMILGYNGIDKKIVELVDVLTIGCRESDTNLRLACANCFGALGAVEPSHLPRTCSDNENSFNFFMTDPSFIILSLNELIRALQSEKNTQNLDRFALAIQETLRTYSISPDETCSGNDLWKLFPENHQELMIPLLSSKYTMAQSIERISVCPIYGSNYASSFSTWLYNWTVNLVLIIKSSMKSILQVCLLSMKQDHKTLMHFLPYILLHSLIEGSQHDHLQIRDEFLVILDDKNTQLTDVILNTRMLRAGNINNSDQNNDQEQSKYEHYTKIIFILLDFLDRWMREWLWSKGYGGREHENYKKIKMFLTHFCKLQLAKCNFMCGEYPRALMYLEDYMESQKNNDSENLSLLAEIYYRLDEPDGVAGVTALKRNESTLEQKILALEASGKLFDVAACYERLSLPLSIKHLQGLMQCYLDLDNVNTALNFARGTMGVHSEYSEYMLEAQAEPLWRLGCYDELDELLKKPELKENESWGVQVGRSLLALKDGDRNCFKSTITKLKLQQLNSIGSASLEEGAYQNGYFYISRLHVLSELEQIEESIHSLLLTANDNKASQNIINKLKNEWDLRLKIVQQSIKITEPILCLRRITIEQAKKMVARQAPNAALLFDALLGDCWLKSAEIARANEVDQQAFTYILKAEEYTPSTLFLEKAKLHWARDEFEEALTTLQHGLDKLLPAEIVGSRTSPTTNLPIEQKKICAEAKLLIASYNDEISNVCTEINTQHYKEAVDMFREWETSLVTLAQYYDRLFQHYTGEDKDSKGSDLQIHMINYFGKSLQYGSNYVYQSMPRLLGIWFDYGTRLLEVTSSKTKEERKNNLLKMTKLVDTFLERLPAYIFLTAFSQLVSRICHPQKEVYVELKAIIIKLILKYPQQTLWMMIPVIKSSYPLRTKRCAEIFSDNKLKSQPMLRFLNDFTKLAEKLIELCNKEITDNISNVSINTFLRTLPRLITKDDFSEIMMPTQMFRKLILPNPDFTSTEHNPFPNNHVHIIGIEDDMVILPSLQRPRKITLRGSDGKSYIQMLKPKDDLRKDFRLMEFNDIVNQMLSREPESRQRRLNIRLYSVAPLNEECGLIEWVPNLVGLRPVLMNLYKQRGLGMKNKELKEACCKLTDPIETKRRIHLNKLLPAHPPVLGDWFRKTFPDAQGWLSARTSYIRTTAVMSMVGYILGLGDRHGENILLDATNGDVVHVDFNCLFNKGESFEWPERVPFRLTQNMVGAMGPLGVEGLFRKSCACTLSVLRSHMHTLMSIVTPFVYDPLVSWPRISAATASNMTSERTNDSALENIKEIKCRLKGQVRTTKSRSYSIPLSVEGQANMLILEAINLDNLCQMYIGWGPYL